MATFAKDTHATASKAALIGGTTTFIEMVCPSRNEDALEGYHTWKQKAEGNSACDYAFHMAVTRYDANTEAQLREIVARWNCVVQDLSCLQELLRRHRRRDVPHAQAGRRVWASSPPRTARMPSWWASCSSCCWPRERPARSGTSPAAPRPLRPKARAASRPSWSRPAQRATWCISPVRRRCARPSKPSCAASSCTSNRCCRTFCSTRAYAERAGVEGMKHVMSPPLRDKRNLPVLWGALKAGLIDTVGTDHCPFDTAQKLLGAKAFHADSQRHSRHRRSREPDVHLRREARRARSSPLCRCAEHAAGQALRPLSAQGNHRRRIGRRPGRLRHGLSRHDLRRHAALPTTTTTDSRALRSRAGRRW